MKVGLRVDVDTFNGTQRGVPKLSELFERHSIKATFFFCVGPDNMGRHIWRLIRPGFLLKMLRTKAANLYGWNILLRGTFWPGPVIGERLGGIIRSTGNANHEIGLHAWDHHAWQSRIDLMDSRAIHDSLDRGFGALTQILGRAPTCSAAPAWKCNDLVLSEKSKFPFRYNSDCRGGNIFLPLINGNEPGQPQIPVTLPTYDEALGRNGISNNNYNEYMLSLLRPDKLNVLTIHAEVEGGACFEMFDHFLTLAAQKGATFVPLGSLLDDCKKTGSAVIIAGKIEGREGWVAKQRPSDSR